MNPIFRSFAWSMLSIITDRTTVIPAHLQATLVWSISRLLRALSNHDLNEITPGFKNRRKETGTQGNGNEDAEVFYHERFHLNSGRVCISLGVICTIVLLGLLLSQCFLADENRGFSTPLHRYSMKSISMTKTLQCRAICKFIPLVF